MDAMQALGETPLKSTAPDAALDQAMAKIAATLAELAAAQPHGLAGLPPDAAQAALAELAATAPDAFRYAMVEAAASAQRGPTGAGDGLGEMLRQLAVAALGDGAVEAGPLVEQLRARFGFAFGGGVNGELAMDAQGVLDTVDLSRLPLETLLRLIVTGSRVTWRELDLAVTQPMQQMAGAVAGRDDADEQPADLPELDLGLLMQLPLSGGPVSPAEVANLQTPPVQVAATPAVADTPASEPFPPGGGAAFTPHEPDPHAAGALGQASGTGADVGNGGSNGNGAGNGDPDSGPPANANAGGNGNGNANGNGHETYIGTNGADLIFGGITDDTIIGRNGDDTLHGGDGDDNLQGQNGDDVLYGGAGDDMLHGQNNDDFLDGGTGDDTLMGGSGDDILVFDVADGVIDGGTGANTLRANGSDIDLTAYGGAIDDFDLVDLATDAAANALVLTADDVLDISAGDIVTVSGDALDSVDAGSGWSDGGVAGGLHTFTKVIGGSTATLALDADINVNADILL